MKYCDTCGNEIEFSAQRCPFCERIQECSSDQSLRIRQSGCKTINIKEGMPAVEEGLQHLERSILHAKNQGISLIRIIHGYGSGGRGGKLKEATRHCLARLQTRHTIRRYFCGEDYSPTNESGRNLLRKYPSLKKHIRTDQNNPGITFAEL